MRCCFAPALSVLMLCGFPAVRAQAPAAPAEPPAAAQEAKLPASAVSVADKPLPKMEDLLAIAKARQARAEELRKSYTYKVTAVADDLDDKGNNKGKHTDEFQTWMVKDVTIQQHLSHDGQPLPPDKAQKEQQRIDNEIASIKDGT